MSRRGVSTMLAAGMAVALIAAPALFGPTRRLVFNTTASAPIGFYWRGDAGVNVGDLALVRPPPGLAQWMARRGYLPANVPMIKHVAAVGDQVVCVRDRIIRVDGIVVATALKKDLVGRPLSAADVCRRLADDEIFLLNAGAPQSLDGRYFGPLRRDCVLGRLHPLWTWER